VSIFTQSARIGKWLPKVLPDGTTFKVPKMNLRCGAVLSSIKDCLRTLYHV
jgi:hypothetical protein